MLRKLFPLKRRFPFLKVFDHANGKKQRSLCVWVGGGVGGWGGWVVEERRGEEGEEGGEEVWGFGEFSGGHRRPLPKKLSLTFFLVK